MPRYSAKEAKKGDDEVSEHVPSQHPGSLTESMMDLKKARSSLGGQSRRQLHLFDLIATYGSVPEDPEAETAQRGLSHGCLQFKMFYPPTFVCPPVSIGDPRTVSRGPSRARGSRARAYDAFTLEQHAVMTAPLHDVVSKSFDYIIIGGGTAGLALAARLTDDPNTTVCVLEAGDANLHDPALLTPVSYLRHFGDKDYDWNFYTTKQKLVSDREFQWNRGRGLGGSSGINFLIWTKPPADEINDIERLGNPGWNWKNFQKYSQKVERFIEPAPEQKQRFGLPGYENDVSRQGSVAFGFPKTISDVDLIAHQTLANAGIPPAQRPYGGDPSGYAWMMNSQDPRTGTRSYATTAYYLPNKDRKNLTVLVRALVSKILTEDGADGKLNAAGVEFIYDDTKTYVVHAKKEVILSAGTIKSPHILELSGIGRRDVLEKAGVPVKMDLPRVGENVQEHYLAFFTFELKSDYDGATFDCLRTPNTLPAQQELYSKRGEGAFTMGMQTSAFLPVEKVTPKAHEIYAKAKAQVERLAREGMPPGLLEQYTIQLERLEPGKHQTGPGCEVFFVPAKIVPDMPIEGKKFVDWFYAMNHPFSRGSIHITSSDPAKAPQIDPRYFDHEAEKEVVPGPEVATDEQLVEFAKSIFVTTWHTCGSCSMLPKEKGGVVDPSLTVYGTNNLRVVDMSVVPLHFTGHTQAFTYALAEQAADIIKGNFTA
ncbi:uncharacterized protein PHACADRAFT_212710 [Phanerochaete carnosa HHB-10118-sp]|uniref:Glucose-methanol-choline oxidoreductase N-terminal domain-containing protein n=1 Tax=Phanerochaete carnosa (strain HHB-10118-sp) TaxID=650164 RepID=K5UQL7_PHACS|nr:uncharacterized protein PHACADRAFT_212710 [Phanerochaete carnosa HHB-10118-sp]EKM52126.1 hypothetical protein PHACADRAFT_212710 [Phanerochaete carnosa HHB-10118-sp]